MEKYIILEIIPTASDPLKGDIVQLSALKVNDFKIVDRFDYRLSEEQIKFKKILEIIDYDKESFQYKEKSEEILNDFENWIGDYQLLIIDNQYTEKYLSKIKNKKESIFNYLNLKYHDNIIEEIINKYNLEASNYIVDLLYEALFHENSHK